MANEKYPDKSVSGRISEKPKPEPPTLKGEVIEKKGGKLKRAFVSEDIVDVKDYVFMDVFIPALKKLIIDIFYNGLNALFYGNSANRTGSPVGRVSYLQYDKMSKNSGANLIQANHVRSPYEYSRIIFKKKEDADTVLNIMDEILERYGKVSVADMMQQIKKTPSGVDWDWGWKDLRGAEVMYSNNGWIIDLPKVVSIK